MRTKQHVPRSGFELALMCALLDEEKTCRKSPSDISLCSWTGGEQHGKDAEGEAAHCLWQEREGGYKDNFLSGLIALTVCRLLPSWRSLIEITCT